VTIDVQGFRDKGKQNSPFPLEQSLSQNIEPNVGKLCLLLMGPQICPGFKVNDLLICKAKVHVVVFIGS